MSCSTPTQSCAHYYEFLVLQCMIPVAGHPRPVRVAATKRKTMEVQHGDICVYYDNITPRHILAAKFLSETDFEMMFSMPSSGLHSVLHVMRSLRPLRRYARC